MLKIYRNFTPKLKKLVFLFKIKIYGFRNKKVKIVIGAGGIRFKGWLSTSKNILNITCKKDWEKYFKKKKISNILAEHVWEHLTKKDSVKGLKNCFKYLKKGGNLRIAVPDGNSSDKNYIDYVKPGGNGPGADDHKRLYTYKSLSSELEEAGFIVKLIEYFDEEKKFRINKWSAKDGYIFRSSKNVQNKHAKNKSLIVDGIKK